MVCTNGHVVGHLRQGHLTSRQLGSLCTSAMMSSSSIVIWSILFMT